MVMVKKTQTADSLEDKLPLDDFIRAYKRAKIDAWYAHALDVDEVVEFECNFEERIKEIRAKIIDAINGRKLTEEELGGWRLETKSVKPKKNNDGVAADGKLNKGILFSNPDMDPRQYEVEEVSFRLIAKPTILFHVISALWIDKVGYKFDSKSISI